MSFVPKPFIPFLFCLCFSLSLSANELPFVKIKSEKAWKNVFRQAKEESKLVFVDVYTDWCGFCKKLDKEVYTDESIIEYFNKNFINVKFDAESKFGFQLAEKFNVISFPTLLFLSPDQDIVEQVTGFVPAPVLLSYGHQTLESWSSLPLLLSDYERGDISKEDQRALINALKKTDAEKAHQIADEYLLQLKESDYDELENIWVASQFGNYFEDVSYKYITHHKDEIIEMHGLGEFQDFMKAAYNDNLILAIRYGDQKLLNKVLVEILPAFTETSDIPEAVFVTKTLYFSQREEWAEYRLAANTFLNNHVMNEERESSLFRIALAVVEETGNHEMIAYAADLLEQALTINDQNFETLTLAAYTDGLQGRFEEAEEKLRRSKALASDEEDHDMLNNIKEAISLLKKR